MAENGSSGSSGGNTGGKTGQSLNHGPGSFAHNNADQLPGGPTKAQETAPNLRAAFDQNRDPLIARQTADLQKTEAQRRRELVSPQSAKKRFTKSRQPHAPTQAPAPRPNLAHSKAVDQAAFNARQREENRHADALSKSMAQAQPDPAAKAASETAKEQFKLSRGFNGTTTQGRSKSPDRGR